MRSLFALLCLPTTALSIWASPSKTADAERIAWLANGGNQSAVTAKIARNRLRRVPRRKHVFTYSKNSTGCGLPLPSSLVSGETRSQTLLRKEPAYDGALKTRNYRVHLPTGYDNTMPTMLVMDFHGYYDTEIIEETRAGMVPASDQDNFIVVFPRGGADAGEWPSWNGVGTVESPGPKGKTCDTNRKYWGYYDCYNTCSITVGCDVSAGCQCSSCYDDIGFIADMLDVLERELCVDLSHVHATGCSNGGMMSYATAYAMPERIASIAPVASAALLGFDEVPKLATSIMEFHGTGDSIIPANTSESYQGNVAPDGATFSSDGFYYVSQPQMTNGFAKAAKCSAADKPGKDVIDYPTDYDGIRGLSCVKPYGTCPDGVDVVQCSGSWGHTWPLGAQVPLAYGRMIYDFFASHPLEDES
jgi:poly(3-hydroxybutyrate) depolymerase